MKIYFWLALYFRVSFVRYLSNFTIPLLAYFRGFFLLFFVKMSLDHQHKTNTFMSCRHYRVKFSWSATPALFLALRFLLLIIADSPRPTILRASTMVLFQGSFFTLRDTSFLLEENVKNLLLQRNICKMRP